MEPRGRDRVSNEREHVSQCGQRASYNWASAAWGASMISAAVLHVDFTDCKTSLSHHGWQISESESEAQGTAKGENQQRGSEERATGLSRQVGAEKEVGGRCQTAINLGSLGDSARLSWGEGDLQRFDNRAVGASEMDGHVCNGNRWDSWERANQWSSWEWTTWTGMERAGKPRHRWESR